MRNAQYNLRPLIYEPGRVGGVIMEALGRAVAEKGQAVMAIPGGRSPGPVLVELAGKLPEEIRKHLHLFWVDERGVSPEDKECNSRSTLATWKKGGPLPEYIYPMPAENPDLEAAARKYAGTLDKITEGRPIDLCLLGIGEDGHCASLFPDHPGLGRGEAVFAVYDSPKPPPRRLTLSLPVLRAAGLRVILAAGKEKGLVFEKAIKGHDPSIPVSLLPVENTIWFVDEYE
ncbi:MAG: 6-phosphogluconolactonase [Candidatus Auribacterota bacterium]|nr:6-phosphogluconolactonase [Candidatus Auribacterota bacterium]